MPLMTYNQAFDLAHKKYIEFFKNNSTHGFAVQVIDDMGSVQFFESAKAEFMDGWWFVYTEHNGFSVYADGDVTVRQYRRIWDVR